MAASVIGAFASCASVLLNISPFRDVLDIHKTGSVNERSILPYCTMMVDGANWVVFAALIDDVFPIGVTNSFGFLAGTFYSTIYLRYSWNDKRANVRREAWCLFMGAIAIMLMIAGAALWIAILWDRKTSTDHIGYVVDFFNVLLYGSPLRLALKVLRTGSTSGMYLPLSLMITAAASLWATYGFLSSDWFVAAPQSVGLVAGIAQLLLFLRFGVADNNQPPVVASESSDSTRGSEGDDEGSTPQEKGERLSDGSKVDAPSAGGGGRSKKSGQLEEPLIGGTESPV